MEEILTNVGTLASFIGSLTVVGSALIWIYNKFIGGPRERKREIEASERQEQMLSMIMKENEPLSHSIDKLTAWVDESVRDREILHKISDENTLHIGKHDERLDKHNDRILVLETKNGIRTYREEYKGENS